MHAIVLVTMLSPIDKLSIKSCEQKLLGRCKSIKSLLLEVIQSQTRNSSGFKIKKRKSIREGVNDFEISASSVHVTRGMVLIFSRIMYLTTKYWV